MKTRLIKLLKTIFIASIISTINLQSFSQIPEFWGMTRVGGEYNSGVIFKTDENGNNQSVEQSFLKVAGRHPFNNKLCEANNGKLYGLTTEGGDTSSGSQGNGLLYEYDPESKIYVNKIEFNVSNGASPRAGLLLATNGKLYGTTSQGGTNGYGVLFEYDPTTNAYIKKVDFDGVNKGSFPYGNLIQADNGKLYGTTIYGGITKDLNFAGDGVLFEYSIDSEIFVKLFDFQKALSGVGPSGVIQTTNGRLYGLTFQGGTANSSSEGDGTLFEYYIDTNSFSTRITFNNITQGWGPRGSLLEAINGKLYGTTYSGGSNDKGVLFEYDIDTFDLVNKQNFNGSDMGGSPRGSLIQLANGKIYGTTNAGGTTVNSVGVLFEFNPDTNDFISEMEFGVIGIESRGNAPEAGLIQATNGKLYGTTTFGGVANDGVLFEYEPITNNYTKEFDFQGYQNGALPHSDMMLADNNKFYGLTRHGGAYGVGTLFEFNPATNILTKKIDFDGVSMGKNPEGNLIQGSNGNFYGLATDNNYEIVLFEYNPLTKIFTNKLSPVDAAKGSEPKGSLLEASNGKFYGLTNGGGIYGKGILFEYNPNTDVFTKKIDFSGTNNGAYPLGSLIQGANGKIYGLTRLGGNSNQGTLFEFDLDTSVLTKKIDLVSINGNTPKGDLIQAANGKFYGMTSIGGANDLGLLFEYDLNLNTIIVKLDFDGTNNGANPEGSLMKASNEKLYGLTTKGGANNYGVMFEFDLTSDTYTKKLDFDGANGYQPYGSLIEINSSLLNTDSYVNDVLGINLFPNPASKVIHINSPLKLSKIEIYSLLGSKVLETKKTDQIDVSSLQTGMYLLKLYTEKGAGVKKIIIE